MIVLSWMFWPWISPEVQLKPGWKMILLERSIACNIVAEASMQLTGNGTTRRTFVYCCQDSMNSISCLLFPRRQFTITQAVHHRSPRSVCFVISIVGPYLPSHQQPCHHRLQGCRSCCRSFHLPSGSAFVSASWLESRLRFSPPFAFFFFSWRLNHCLSPVHLYWSTRSGMRPR